MIQKLIKTICMSSQRVLDVRKMWVAQTVLQRLCRDIRSFCSSQQYAFASMSDGYNILNGNKCWPGNVLGRERNCWRLMFLSATVWTFVNRRHPTTAWSSCGIPRKKSAFISKYAHSC